MLRTTPRGTHRAEGPAVVDYRSLLAPVSKGATGVAAATAIAATGAAGLTLQSATAVELPAKPATKNLAAASAIPATLQGTTVSVKNLGTSTLRYGARGNAVATLQNALRERGANISADGVFGPATRAAVRAFQDSANLSVDGVVGPNTWSALKGGSSATVTPAAVQEQKSSAPASSSSSFSADSIIRHAESQVGKSYVWGSSNPNVGFDCSGLVKWVYNQNGISVPRTAKQQTFAGRIIPRSEARPGDLVSFPSGDYGHIGIYLGDNMIIDAGRSKNQVVKRQIWTDEVVFVTYR